MKIGIKVNKMMNGKKIKNMMELASKMNNVEINDGFLNKEFIIKLPFTELEDYFYDDMDILIELVKNNKISEIRYIHNTDDIVVREYGRIIDFLNSRVSTFTDKKIISNM